MRAAKDGSVRPGRTATRNRSLFVSGTIAEAMTQESSQERPVGNSTPGSLHQRFGGVKLHFEIADLRDGEDVLPAVLLAAVDPARVGAKAKRQVFETSFGMF